MSGLFGKPKMPRMPAAEQYIPPVAVEEDAESARRRERKRLLTGGRKATILSGIQSALKRRLGE